jgi:hypothetical protein
MRYVALGVTFLAVSLLAVGSLIGDDKKPDTKEPEPKLKGPLPKYYKQLLLSDDQKQSIYKLRDRYSAKIDELEKKIKDLKVERDGEYAKVLTKVQLARLRELQTGVKDKPKDGDKDKPKDAPEKDKPKDAPAKDKVKKDT